MLYYHSLLSHQAAAPSCPSPRAISGVIEPFGVIGRLDLK